MAKKPKLDAEQIELPSGFHKYINENVKKSFKNTIVEGLPVYVKESSQFVDYIEATIKDVTSDLIKNIVAEKLGLVRSGSTFRLPNETKHPLAAMINNLFHDEVEDLVKSVGKEIISSTVAEIRTSIQEDKDFVQNVKESMKDTLQQMVINYIKQDIVDNSQATVTEALEEIGKKL